MKYFILAMLTAFVLACNVSDKKAGGKDEAKVASMQKEGSDAIADPAKATTLEWIDPVEQNLGQLEKGQLAEISWKFKNTGKNLLYIANVRAGCGCTTPDPPKEPIAPGAEGVIKAKFNSSNFDGHVVKEVYVQANNSNRNNGQDNKLTFTADIRK